jgi:hypothetical protein
MVKEGREIDLLVTASRGMVALSTPRLATLRADAETLLADLANALDTAEDPVVVARVEEALTALARAAGRAEKDADAAPRSWFTEARVARRRAEEKIPIRHVRIDRMQLWRILASSAYGRAVRKTKTGMLAARVEELVESVTRTKMLASAIPNPRTGRARAHQGQYDLHVFALRRMRDALALALEEARPLADDPRPFVRGLEPSLLAGTEELARLDAYLHPKPQPQPRTPPRPPPSAVPRIVRLAWAAARRRAENRGQRGGDVPRDLLARELTKFGLDLDDTRVTQVLDDLRGPLSPDDPRLSR